MDFKRRLPIGAEVINSGEVHFRVWAPNAVHKVEVVLSGTGHPLESEGGGYYSGLVRAAAAGALYSYRLDGQRESYPDPASRFQPDGPHGPSQVVDPDKFSWTDSAWRGPAREGQAIYEMHIGTFTPEGNWAAAARQLDELADLGITMLEIMPVADFPGKFGWGYDGVNLFAPCRLYGEPDEFRSFVDMAHAAGLAVILDVVYNHFGPDGNYLKKFSPDYFSDRYENEWGEPINFDGPEAGPVREFFIANAAYWVREFHIDGLRLDATQQIFDASPVNIMTSITSAVRDAARGKQTYVVAENEPQDARLARPVAQGGHGMDAMWNDDFHHSAMVALTGKNPAYYSDYLGEPQEFISALKWGFLYQGQRYSWQKKRRGQPALDLAPSQFVTFIQNHDQIANSVQGWRCHLSTSPGRYRAMTALLLLGPGTPMLFQGQEFASSAPFYYFADHNKELAPLVASGRRKFMSQFPAGALPEVQGSIPDPAEPRTFERCRLDFEERMRNAEVYALHGDLLRCRDDRVLRSQRPRGMDGAVLGPEAFVLRFFADDGEDRLLLVNFGRDLHLHQAPVPLLAPPAGRSWRVFWSSEDLCYGGVGTPPLEGEDNWCIPAEAAVLMHPAPIPEPAAKEEKKHG